MPELFDITNWNPQPWYSTGGTRSKKYVQNPSNGKYYYFKKSYKTPGRDYFFEFWSEIIATEVGLMLGFNVLNYDLAIDASNMGCISESMISEEETLTEGGKYLRAREINFDPSAKEARKLHSFQLIKAALNMFNLSEHIEHIIEILVFDSIIGNGDRHQENWAFINKATFINKSLNEVETEIKSKGYANMPWVIRILLKPLYDIMKNALRQEVKETELFLQKTKSFAPIFDNGSSLGRELENEKIDRMLNDDAELLAYIKRGESEIHWNNKKFKHLEIVKQLLQTEYSERVLETIKRVANKFDSEKIKNIIFNIDAKVPEGYNKFKLPDNRKDLMVKLITLRIAELKSLLK
jgi:hypothetical protein